MDTGRLDILTGSTVINAWGREPPAIILRVQEDFLRENGTTNFATFSARSTGQETARARGRVLIKAGNSEGFGGAWSGSGVGGAEVIRIAG